MQALAKASMSHGQRYQQGSKSTQPGTPLWQKTHLHLRHSAAEAPLEASLTFSVAKTAKKMCQRIFNVKRKRVKKEASVSKGPKFHTGGGLSTLRILLYRYCLLALPTTALLPQGHAPDNLRLVTSPNRTSLYNVPVDLLRG